MAAPKDEAAARRRNRRPLSLTEFLASDAPSGAPLPRRQMDPAPPWARTLPRRAPTGGPFMPLPRESELPARRAMLAQVRGPQPSYRPPPMVWGPGGVDDRAPRVRFSDVASPGFIPFQGEIPPMIEPMGGPESPARFEPGAGQPPAQATPPMDLDAEWEAALQRARLALTKGAASKPSLSARFPSAH